MLQHCLWNTLLSVSSHLLKVAAVPRQKQHRDHCRVFYCRHDIQVVVYSKSLTSLLISVQHVYQQMQS